MPTRRTFLYLASATLLTRGRQAFSQAPSQAPIQAPTKMARDADPSFEVATVRRTDPTDRSSGFHTEGRHIFIENWTVNDILSFVYALHHAQIVGAPSWFSSDRYDIKGVPDADGEPSLNQLRSMTKKLIADRFQMKSHAEQRELSVYTLTLAKGGPKLAATKSADDDLPDETGSGQGNQMDFKCTNCSMTDLVMSMQSFFADRPIVDKTGLTGRYDFELRWTPDTLQNADANAAPGLFTALQDQLGLKLEATRSLAGVLVIDHAERPSLD